MAEPKAKRQLPLQRKLAFVGIMLLLPVLLFEGGLQILCLASPEFAAFLNPNKNENMPDPILGTRPHPDWPDHDDWGFRNAERPDHAAIVAVGDSQTYGTSVSRDEAWPQQLAEISGVSTYNMAYGGWGVAHYLLLLDEALALSPDVIVVGFYSGNDLFGTYGHVYKRDRAVELRSEDAQVLAALAQARKSDKELKLGWELTRQAIAGEMVTWEKPARFPPPVSPLPHVRPKVDRVTSAHSSRPSPVRTGGGFERNSWLQYSKLYLLTATLADLRGGRRVARDRLNWTRDKERADKAPAALLLAVDNGSVRTILTPAARLTALATDDVRIAEGLRAAHDAFALMRDRIGGARKLVVLLIPTKELAFYEMARRTLPSIPVELSQLAEQEAAVWRETKAFLDAAGIAWIDALPALRAGVDAGENPYYIDWDGHPNAIGNRILAEAIATSAAVPTVARNGGR